MTGICLSCDEGFYGGSCDLTCSPLCAQGVSKPVCSISDGRCLDCKPGFHGNLCDQKCSEHCGIAEDSGVKVGPCDRDTGLCLHGCADGWYNSTCQDKCSNNCLGEACNIDDGKCSVGCVPGFKGDFCSLQGRLRRDVSVGAF